MEYPDVIDPAMPARAVTLTRTRPETSGQALARWDNEGGAVSPRVDIARRR